MADFGEHDERDCAGEGMERRDFLKKGLGAAGAAALAAGAIVRPGSAAEVAPGSPAAVEPRLTALTADGRLVEVPAASALPAALPRTDPALRRGIEGRRWVMVIDLALCDGCDDCVDACRESHSIPPDRDWLRIYRMQDTPETAPYWFPKPCFHCDNPPCTKVCPVGATFKRSDGLVLVDGERCIGCRFCMAACPYSGRVFNWSRPDASEAVHSTGGGPRRVGTVEKCDFCADELAKGELPHCVTTCTMGAVYFGDANEDAVTNGKGETVRLSRLLHDRAGYRFHEDLGTEPRVYYLPPSGRRYPAPTSPKSSGAAASHAAEAS